MHSLIGYVFTRDLRLKSVRLLYFMCTHKCIIFLVSCDTVFSVYHLYNSYKMCQDLPKPCDASLIATVLTVHVVFHL